MAMNSAYRDFTWSTPSSNALNYIDPMLRDSRDPIYMVYSPARTDGDQDPGPYLIAALNETSSLGVAIVCFPLAEHSTQFVVFVSGDVEPQVCSTERDNLVNEIFALNLD
jgi:hypothetical protein